MDAKRELSWLRKVRDLSHRLSTEESLTGLFPRILDHAIELTEAERGFLVVLQRRMPDGDCKIKVVAARGFGRSTFRSSVDDVSRTVVQRVIERGRGLVTTDESEDEDVLNASSVLARRVRSILCVPLVLRSEMRGVLYLDHRFEHGAFSERDLPILGSFAEQAALALETAQLLADRCELGRSLHELKALREAREQDAWTPPTTHESPGQTRFGGLVGATPVMGALYEEIERAARSRAPVLLLGESGTGKELVARELHARGSHASERFITQSCAAAAEEVLASELWGHRREAFSGAVADRAGVLVDARHGTVLLDEVADLPSALQATLVQVLERRQVLPLGADQPVPVSCRLIAATHRGLGALVGTDAFREDLFYRLDVLRIVVPPLCQRLDDVPLLLAHFLARYAAPTPKVSQRALGLLQSYHWPGNVRQLQNEVQRLMALGVPRVEPQHLSAEVREGRGVSHAKAANFSGKTLVEVEREMIVAALETCRGNKSQAARQLGIPRTSLYSLIQRHGL